MDANLSLSIPRQDTMKKLRQLTRLRVSDRIAVATALALSLTAVASQYETIAPSAETLDSKAPIAQPVAKKPLNDPSSDEHTHRSRQSARALLFRHG